MIKGISHVAVATRSIAVNSEFYKTLGLEIETIEVLEDQKVKVAMLRVGEARLELLEATQEDSPVARFIDRHGEGLHHLSLEVDNLKEHLQELKARNVRLIDEEPRLGARGSLIAFIHPESTGGLLVELTQCPDSED